MRLIPAPQKNLLVKIWYCDERPDMLCIPLTAQFPINIHQFGGQHLATFQVIQIKQAVQACPDPYNCAISILQLVQYMVLVTVAGGYTMVYPPFRDERCQDWQIEERPCFVWLDRSLWFGDGRWLRQRWKPASDVCLRYRGNVTCRNFDGIFGQLMTQLFFWGTQFLKVSDGSEIHEFILRWTSWKWNTLLSNWQVACLSKLLGCPNSWKHLEQPDGPGDFPKVRNRTRAPQDFTPGVTWLH